MKILISACLLGLPCRYDGASKPQLWGAACALRLYQLLGCKAAVLKERSPSCGCGAVYDGTFTGTLTAGDGVTAALLQAHGIRVLGESQVLELLAPDGEKP